APPILLAVVNMEPDGMEYMRLFWSYGLLPDRPWSISDYLWPVRMALQAMVKPLGPGQFRLGAAPNHLTFPGAVVLLCAAVAGVVTLKRSRSEILLVLLLPCVAVFLGATARVYPLGSAYGPFGGRTLLFLVPAMLTLIAAGVQAIQARLA